MITLTQSPTDPAFVQNPYPFYARARAAGHLIYWDDYAMPAAVSHGAVSALLRDKRLGRVPPTAAQIPTHLTQFYALEAHSMLELEPPAHSRLRGLVLRAFTSRRVMDMAGDITSLAHEILDQLPDGPFDLLHHYAQPFPVRIICRLLGVPEEMAPQLLSWSNAMVALYQSRRDRAIEDQAEAAARAFSTYLRDYIDARRRQPGPDLITSLIAAEEDGARLSTDELISTCILLLNAGHEATVHTIGNSVATLDRLSPETDRDLSPQGIEELLRLEPPLHIFTRWVYEDLEVFGTPLSAGTQIALVLGAAGRDPFVYEDPDRYWPARVAKPHAAFGAGLHFCVGAQLARLELRLALEVLYQRFPKLHVVEPPTYANCYHFHGLTRLMVDR